MVRFMHSPEGSADLTYQKALLVANFGSYPYVGYTKEATFSGTFCIFRHFGVDLFLFPLTSY
jgi:hypothetical protein